ncbi:hypothetical protein GF342_03590 [Candidatus Woesearchaeota archaeon]|nr:hypothetical protein [Candidatus Woesearchaeota archaeon]
MRRALLLFILLAPLVLAQTYPDPVGYVNDFAHILEGPDEVRIDALLNRIEQNLTVEIAVVTVENLNQLTIERYANELAREWQIGKESANNGMLILIVPKTQTQKGQYRFEIASGLQGIITDSRSGRIGRNTLVPYFKEGRYGEGVYQALLQIEGLLQQDPSVIADVDTEFTEDNLTFLFVIYFIVFFVIEIASGMSSKKYWVKGGAHVLALVSAFLWSFAAVAVVGFLMFMFWLFYAGGSGGGGYFGGGHGGSSGGFGGFSGGGGFTGGGSSGSW